MPHRFPDGLPAVVRATIARLERRLPATGQILVHADSRVEPDDVIGQCNVPGEPVLIDVAGALGMAPRELGRRLRHKLGDHVAFRDLLARRRGRNLLAPVDGTITTIDEATGFVVITPDPSPVNVLAAIRGTVADVVPSQSVSIAAPAAIVHGAVGFGGEQWGVLRLLVTDPDAIITPEMIDARSAFAVVIGGAGITAEALQRAHQEQVKGVVVGGVDAEELRRYWGDRFRGNWSHLLQTGTAAGSFAKGPTIFVTEGFGTRPMSRPTFDLLTRYDRQEVHLDGTTRLLPPNRRPRLLIPIARVPEGMPSPAPMQSVHVGSQVRLLDEPHLGQLGLVEAIHPQGRLASGARAAVARVVLAAGQRVELPTAALEPVE